MRVTAMSIALLLAAGPAWATMYKWVDEQGKTHYGDTIPPQYAGQGKSEINHKGREVNRTEGALTPEQRQARDAEAARKKEEEQKMLDQKRRDKALLATYASEKEIDRARDRNLAQTTAAIDSAQVRLKAAKAKLTELQGQAGKLTQARKPVPPDLADDIKRAEGDAQKVEAEIADKQKLADAIKARYEGDKQRYLELTQPGTNSARK